MTDLSRFFWANPEWIKSYRLTANRFRFSVVAATMGAVVLAFLMAATLLVYTSHIATDGTLRITSERLREILFCYYVMILYGFIAVIAIVFTVNEVNRNVTLDADVKRAHLFLAGPLSASQKITGKGLPPVILLLLGFVMPFHAAFALATGTTATDLVIAYCTLLLLVLTLGTALQLCSKPVESDGKRTTSAAAAVFIALIFAGPLLGGIGASGTLLLDLLRAATGLWVLTPAYELLNNHHPITTAMAGVIDLRLAGILIYGWLLGWLVRWARQKYRTIGPYAIPGYELSMFLLLSHAFFGILVFADAARDPLQHTVFSWSYVSIMIGALFVFVRVLSRLPDAIALKIRYVRKLTGCRIESDHNRPSLWAAFSLTALIASLWLQLNVLQVKFGISAVSDHDLTRFAGFALVVFIIFMIEIVGLELLRLLIANRSAFQSLFGVHLIFIPILLYFSKVVLKSNLLVGIFMLGIGDWGDTAFSEQVWPSVMLYVVLLVLLVLANIMVTRRLRSRFAREEITAR